MPIARNLTLLARDRFVKLHFILDSLFIFGDKVKGAIGWIAGFCMLIAMIGCAPGNRSTREKRSGIGDTAGGNTSGIPDTAGGQPATGVVIGRSLGLATGFLVGDQLQGQESLKPDQRLEIDGNQAEIQRQRRDMEKIRRQGEY